MKQQVITAVLCAAFLIATLGGCNTTAQTSSYSDTSSSVISSWGITGTQTLAGSYSDRDRESQYDEQAAVKIAMNGDSAEISGGGAIYDQGVITITKAGTYLLTGSLTDGQVIVAAQDTDKVQIVLSNANIQCSYGSGIYIKKADKVFITLDKDTNNTIADGKVYSLTDPENDSNAAIFSKADLTMNGEGTLTISANYNHGVHSKDDLVITGGSYIIDSVNDGLKGKDCVQILDGSFTLKTGGDGISSSNNTDTLLGNVVIDGGKFVIESVGDGIQAETALTVTGGNFQITTAGGAENAPERQQEQFPGGGGQRPDRTGQTWNGNPNGGAKAATQTATGGTVLPVSVNGTTSGSTTSQTATETETISTKGIKAVTNLTISGGEFVLDTVDDSLHTNGNLYVNGGSFTISSGDDGVHADGGLEIRDANILIKKSYEGLEGETVKIFSGNINITASDDGINAADATQSSAPGRPTANANITIAGGTIYVDANGDGIDSNSDLNVTGGTVVVCCSSGTPDSALDFDGTAVITGGTVAAFGSSQMAQSFGESVNQGQIMIGFSSNVPENTPISLADSQGNTLLTVQSSKSFGNLLLCSPEIQQGETYTLYQGGSHSGTLAGGCYTGGTYTQGEKVLDITMTQLTMKLNQDGTTYSGGMGGKGGMGGGRPSGMTPPDGITPPNGMEPPDGQQPPWDLSQQSSTPSSQG